jgi:Homeodomain-like domain-containing protein/LAGLIDADG DNA endonuclease family protein
VFVHTATLHQAALALIAEGVNDCEISRRLGVPRTTVRDWRRPRYVAARRDVCWRCWRATRRVGFEPADYAQLLGLYLGDGYIGTLARTQRLRIFLDARYTTIVAETDALLRRCFPDNRVGRLSRHAGAMVVLWVYHGHLSCLFPQHGPGKKHERPIVLEPWQASIVDAEPWAFLRGLIRSDGCVFINRTGKYEYLSYEFSNLSPGIRERFTRTCARVGVVCRAYGNRIRICQRPSVALMLEHVGTKT